MQKGEAVESFSYWKRPYHKWVILAAAILQFLCLWINIRKFRDVTQAGIFSAAEWENYTAQKGLQCAINGLTAAAFLGSFLIGVLARSRKAARLAEGMLLLCLALFWGAGGLVFHLAVAGSGRVIWILLLLSALGGSVYSFSRSRGK